MIFKGTHFEFPFLCDIPSQEKMHANLQGGGYVVSFEKYTTHIY